MELVTKLDVNGYKVDAFTETMGNISEVAIERHFAGPHTGMALAAFITGCGGGGGASTSNTSGSAGGAGTVTTLLEQPQENSIAGNVVVPLADKSKPPIGTFKLVLWQPDPFTTNGELVPTAWNASSQTGFAPSNPMSDQLGFQNKPGTSTAQMEGDTVGAYINSQDLPSSPVDPGGGSCGHVAASSVEKMMITPQYIWSSGTEPVPFASSTTVLSGSMDLQVPTASGDSYVVADLLFKDPNGVRVSYGVKLFGNGVTNPSVGCGYDAPSKSYRINSPLGIDERFVSKAANSASDTGAPWLGWRHIEWSISQSQFTAALQYLATQFPGQIPVVDPTQYKLAEVHLNAEIDFQPSAAELGWSMRGLKIWLVD